MRVVHRISDSSSPSAVEELRDLGVVDLLVDDILITFEIDESSVSWPEVEAWARRNDAVDVVSTIFTDAELAAAAWLDLGGEWLNGYPQPDDDLRYLTVSYDLTDFCQECGIGARQTGPLRLKREPGWGRRGIMQLHWLYGDFFVPPEVFGKFFEPAGARRRAVQGRKGDPLAGVVQLDVADVVELDITGLAGEVCSNCGRTKFAVPTAGPSPEPLDPPAGAGIAQSAQWFGTGAEAHRLMLVSRSVAQALTAAKIRGATFRPAVGPQAFRTG